MSGSCKRRNSAATYIGSGVPPYHGARSRLLLTYGNSHQPQKRTNVCANAATKQPRAVTRNVRTDTHARVTYQSVQVRVGGRDEQDAVGSQRRLKVCGATSRERPHCHQKPKTHTHRPLVSLTITTTHHLPSHKLPDNSKRTCSPLGRDSSRHLTQSSHPAYPLTLISSRTINLHGKI